jgi:hypothetical protein
MYRLALFAIVLCLFTGSIAAQETSTPLSQEDLKSRVVAIFDSLGKIPETNFDLVIITITRHTQVEHSEIDSSSLKISNSGVTATKIISGQATKQTITLRSGVIGKKAINKLEEGEATIVPISEKRIIGTTYNPATTSKK